MDDIAIEGQKSNYTTWRVAKMNLAVRGIDADIRWNNEGSFHKDESAQRTLAERAVQPVIAHPLWSEQLWGKLRVSGRIPY